LGKPGSTRPSLLVTLAVWDTGGPRRDSFGPLETKARHGLSAMTVDGERSSTQRFSRSKTRRSCGRPRPRSSLPSQSSTNSPGAHVAQPVLDRPPGARGRRPLPIQRFGPNLRVQALCVLLFSDAPSPTRAPRRQFALSRHSIYNGFTRCE
jgi:hypothetical protein